MLSYAACVIRLSGDYNVYSAPQLEQQLQPASVAPRAVLDFSDVRYIDSAAIGVLLRFHKGRMAAGYPPVAFAGVSPNVLRVLQIVGLDAVWPLFANTSEAAAAIA